MNLKVTALAAAIAAASWGSAYAQSQEASPPSSTTQDMQEPAAPMDSTAPNDGAAGAQTSPGAAPGATSPSNDEMTAAQQPIDQKKVEQFADAYVQVQTIQQKANADLEAATDPAQADQVRTTAQTDMIAAVERSGLQIEEFNQIVASLAADTELRSRVSAEVQKRIATTPEPGAGT